MRYHLRVAYTFSNHETITATPRQAFCALRHTSVAWVASTGGLLSQVAYFHRWLTSTGELISQVGCFPRWVASTGGLLTTVHKHVRIQKQVLPVPVLLMISLMTNIPEGRPEKMSDRLTNVSCIICNEKRTKC